MAQQGIILNNNATACSPLLLNIKCGTTGGQVNYNLNISDEGIVFKRNGLKSINSVIVNIDNPIYIGCNKINLGNTGLFFTGDELGPTEITFQDIKLDGTLGATGSAIVESEITATAFSYTIAWENFNISLDNFEGCNMVLTFDGGNDLQLSKPPGFPLCDPPDNQCYSICSNVFVCGSTDPPGGN